LTQVLNPISIVQPLAIATNLLEAPSQQVAPKIQRSDIKSLPEKIQQQTLPITEESETNTPSEWSSIEELLNFSTPTPAPKTTPSETTPASTINRKTVDQKTLNSNKKSVSSAASPANITNQPQPKKIQAKPVQPKTESVTPSRRSPTYEPLPALTIIQKQTSSPTIQPKEVPPISTFEPTKTVTIQRTPQGDNGRDQSPKGSASSLEKLAHAIYSHVRQRIQIERERNGINYRKRF
jgi:hypothetical protein